METRRLLCLLREVKVSTKEGKENLNPHMVTPTPLRITFSPNAPRRGTRRVKAKKGADSFARSLKFSHNIDKEDGVRINLLSY